MKSEVQVAIIGTGFAGLSIAAGLHASGCEEVLLLERSAHVGGLMQSVERDGYIVEPAAGSFLLPHPHLSATMQALGAACIPATKHASTRYVHLNGRLIRIASPKNAVFAPIGSPRAKLRALREMRVPANTRNQSDPEETLLGFMTRRFGPVLGEIGATLAAAGVYAGDPDQLIASAAFPMLTQLEQSDGSVLRGIRARMKSRPENVPKPTTHIPQGSMSALVRTAAARFGDRVMLNHQVREVRREGTTWVLDGPTVIRADHVVLAVDPLEVGSLLGGEWAALLGRQMYAPVTVVALGGSTDALPLPPGFGVLPAGSKELPTRGVLFESQYAPHRAPEGHALSKVILGGVGHPSVAGMSDEVLVERAARDTELLIGKPVAPSFAEVIRHPRGIPQYTAGHEAWRARVMQQVATQPGLHLGGWGYFGVGLTHLATDARRILTNILGPTPDTPRATDA